MLCDGFGPDAPTVEDPRDKVIELCREALIASRDDVFQILRELEIQGSGKESMQRQQLAMHDKALAAINGIGKNALAQGRGD